MGTKSILRTQKVGLLRLVRTAKGWSRVAVPSGGTRGWEARLDRDTAPYGDDVVDLGEYQIRWYENRNGTSKVRYEPGGSTYAAAREALDRRRERLHLLRAAEQAGVQLAEPETSVPLAERIEEFLEDRLARKTITPGSTPQKYRNHVAEFLAVTKVRHPEQVTAATLARFLTILQQRGLSDRTQLNIYSSVGAFLRYCDDRLDKIVRNYTPRVARKKPVSYSQVEIETLLAYLRSDQRPTGSRRSLDDDQRIALAAETFWKTGLRERELTCLTWDQVDFATGFLTIQNDRQLHLKIKGVEKSVTFQTKTRRDRDIRIPIEKALLERLRTWHDRYPNDHFLFPTSKGNPDRHVLLRVKIAAHRAGLSCGHCEHCRHPCGECQNCRCGQCSHCRTGRRCLHPHPPAQGQQCTRIQCEKWKLHRLRHTFATTAARKGTDLAMLMNLLGHSKLSTTQIYISAASENEAQAAIQNMFPG